MAKTKFKSIEELFNHVLKEYEEAEEGAIWEYSRNIKESEKILQAEVAFYKSEFKRLTALAEKGGAECVK